jgi:CheY-specific phosphatase CheX
MLPQSLPDSRDKSPVKGRSMKPSRGPTAAVTKRALLVERLAGPLNALTPSLKNLGYEVVRASDANAVKRLIGSLRRLSLVIINGSSVRSDPTWLVGAIKENHPDLPVLWFQSEPRLGVALPKKIDFVGTDMEKLGARIARLVHEDFYSPALIREVIESTRAVLSEFGWDTQASDPCIKSSLTTLNEVTSLIFFWGSGLAGHILLTASAGDLTRMHSVQFPRAPATGQDDLEDFLGEIANQIVGQIKGWVNLDGGDSRMGLPHFIRGAGAGFRYKAGTPSLAIDFSSEGRKLQLEVCMHRFDSVPQRGERSQQLKRGTLTFL